MTIVQQDTEFAGCTGNCNQGRACDCDLDATEDWLDRYPALAAITAVAVIAIAVIVSANYPWNWFQ